MRRTGEATGLSPVDGCQAPPCDLTAERHETKYFIDAALVPALCSQLAFMMHGERHTPATSRVDGGAEQLISTAYFDTISRQLWRASNACPHDNLKIRAREYAQATPPRKDLGVIWLEVKRRAGMRTAKQRVMLARADLGAFLRGAQATTSIGSPERAGGPVAYIIEQCRAIREPLVTSCVVVARRFAFQDAAGTLRVTADCDICYCAPPTDDLWMRAQPLASIELGPPVSTQTRAIIEVKSRVHMPGWLERLLVESRAEATTFSKFAAASAAVDAHLSSGLDTGIAAY